VPRSGSQNRKMSSKALPYWALMLGSSEFCWGVIGFSTVASPRRPSSPTTFRAMNQDYIDAEVYWEPSQAKPAQARASQYYLEALEMGSVIEDDDDDNDAITAELFTEQLEKFHEEMKKVTKAAAEGTFVQEDDEDNARAYPAIEDTYLGTFDLGVDAAKSTMSWYKTTTTTRVRRSLLLISLKYLKLPKL
jgi:hypothetical protein